MDRRKMDLLDWARKVSQLKPQFRREEQLVFKSSACDRYVGIKAYRICKAFAFWV